MWLFSLRLLIFRGRAPDFVLEIPPEERLVSEVQHIGHLLDGVFAAFEQGFRFEDDEIGNPVAGKTAACLMDDLRQVLGCYAQHVGIV